MAGALFISACSPDSNSPTEPVAPPVQESIVPSGCPTVAQTANMITTLYPRGRERLVAAASYVVVLLYINTGHQADARTLVFRLLDYTFTQFNAGKLVGGGSLATRQALLAFEKGLYCTVGLPTTGLTLPGDPGDSGTVNKVVFPSNTSQNVVTSDGNAGVQLPQNSFSGPAVVVTISKTTDTLHTNLDKYGPFYDVKVTPEAAITADLTVGICLSAAEYPDSVFLAHNISPTSIEVLPPGGPITGLCLTQPPPPPMGMIGHAMRDLAMHGEFRRAGSEIGAAMVNLVIPENAYAGSGGKTGTTKSFSPFGGVDTKVYMTANSPTSQTAPAGSPVASPPSALVKTYKGTDVQNVNVLFSVTGGGGTVAGETSSTVATDATGVATASNWVINADLNTVQAVGTYADPTVTFVPSTVTGFPQAVTVSPTGGITFSATGGDIVPYGSLYLYRAGAFDHDPGFQAVTYSTDGWSSGSGAFGTLGSTACPIFGDTEFPLKTSWPTNTDLTLRKTFTLPSGWNVPLTVSAAIDNDIIVYVNGNALTTYSYPQNGNYSFNATSGFVSHENCATKGELTFTVPTGFLVQGQNVLAIRARDRGSVNYVDVKVSPQIP